MSVDEIIAAIDSLTVLELVELKDKLQEKYGVSAAMPAVGMMMAAGAAGGAAAEEAEEQTEFKVTLEAVGENKVPVIKAVREVTNLGLKEAKELVETAGAVVAENVSKEDANNIKAKLEEAGASVKIS